AQAHPNGGLRVFETQGGRPRRAGLRGKPTQRSGLRRRRNGAALTCRQTRKFALPLEASFVACASRRRQRAASACAPLPFHTSLDFERNARTAADAFLSRAHCTSGGTPIDTGVR